ncbi:MAG: 50S ribosomal protein L6 [Bacteroidales bacterium]|nr:50S ribosomal protein L6 [Bacteroidales bacterium]
MSRIGKLPIHIPQNVDVKVNGEELVVKGPLGEMKQVVNPMIKVSVEEGKIVFSRPNDEKETKAMHGLYRALTANMVKGVSEGFKTVQEVIGVGYKVQATGNVLEMDLGYSHKVFLELAPEIKVETVTEKGKNPIITMTCCDKQILGQAAAKIRSLRRPEPYKGKGIRFQGEEIRRKAGKAAAK